MSRQTRPTGHFDRASVAWKLRVLARMDEKGVSRADLARQVGCKVQAISLLLGKKGTKPVESSSKLVAPINKALGLREVQISEGDDLRGRFLRAEPDLNETQRSIIEATIAATLRRD